MSTHAAEHGVATEAEAFVSFLRSDEAQRAFAEYGFRKPDGTSAAVSAGAEQGAPVLFRISDLGGWKAVIPTIFGPDGAFTKTWERVYAE